LFLKNDAWYRLNGHRILAVISVAVPISIHSARGQKALSPQQIAISEIRASTEALQQRQAMTETYQAQLAGERAQMARLNQQKQDSIWSTQSSIANAVLGVGKVSGIVREIDAGNAITVSTLNDAKEAKDHLSEVSNPWTDYKKFDAAASQYDQLTQTYRQNAAALTHYNADTDEMYSRRDALVSAAKANGYFQNFTPTDFRKKDDFGREDGGESKRLDQSDGSELGQDCIQWDEPGRPECGDGSRAPTQTFSPLDSSSGSGRAPAWTTIR